MINISQSIFTLVKNYSEKITNKICKIIMIMEHIIDEESRAAYYLFFEKNI